MSHDGWQVLRDEAMAGLHILRILNAGAKHVRFAELFGRHLQDVQLVALRHDRLGNLLVTLSSLQVGVRLSCVASRPIVSLVIRRA